MPWLGVDVGGTFTDLVSVRSRRAGSSKVLKTPVDAAQPVGGHSYRHRQAWQSSQRKIDAVRRTAPRSPPTPRWSATARSIAVLVTAGHKDVLVVGRGNRMAMYNIKARAAAAAGARGRNASRCASACGSDGSVSIGRSTRPKCDAIGERLAADEVEAVAICFLHAYANPAHERSVPSWSRSSAARCHGHDVGRGAARVPRVRALLHHRAQRLRGAAHAPLPRRLCAAAWPMPGCAAPLSIMTSNGGSLPADRVEAHAGAVDAVGTRRPE